MLTLLLALAQDPAVQAVPPVGVTAAPSSVTSADLTVLQGTMMAWNRGGQLEGEVAFTVQNSGAPDRVISVSTPSGPSGKISLQVARDGVAANLADGVMTLAGVNADGTPGLSRVTLGLTGLTSNYPMPVRTTITVRFETAGEVTISADPVSPAPPPPNTPPRL